MTARAGTTELIKSLRFTLGDTQRQFAKRLGVTQPMISAWEAGTEVPSPEAFLRLGTLASDERMYGVAFQLWAKAGMDQEKILVASDAVLRERGKIQGQGEVFRLNRFERNTAEFGERLAGPEIPLPSEFIEDPAQTRCFVVRPEAANIFFSAGDVVVVDESKNEAKDLTPFWDRIVLVEFSPGEPGEEIVSVRRWWPTGLCIGRLSLKPGGLQYYADLGTFGREDRPLMIGQWEYPPTDPKRQLSDIGLWKEAAIRKAVKEAEVMAPSTVRLFHGVRILGRAVGWLRKREKK